MRITSIVKDSRKYSTKEIAVERLSDWVENRIMVVIKTANGSEHCTVDGNELRKSIKVVMSEELGVKV